MIATASVARVKNWQAERLPYNADVKDSLLFVDESYLHRDARLVPQKRDKFRDDH
jgi:hypothetical protein